MILALGKDLEKKLPGVSQGQVAPYTLSMSPPALSLVAWPGARCGPSSRLPCYLPALCSLVLPPSGTLIFWIWEMGCHKGHHSDLSQGTGVSEAYLSLLFGSSLSHCPSSLF